MRKYLARRLVQNVLTFFLFLTLVYFLLDAQPGDFSNIFLNSSLTWIRTSKHVSPGNNNVGKFTCCLSYSFTIDHITDISSTIANIDANLCIG